MPRLKTSGICALVAGVVFVAVYLAASADVLAARKKGDGGYSRSGQASSGSVHTGNRGNQRDAGRNRGGNQRDARGNRGGNRSDARKADKRSDARRADKRRDARDDRRKRRVVRNLTRAAFRALSCTPRSVIVVTNGIPYTYYSCGSGWYQRGYEGTAVVYVVVVAPPGY